jgi:uncharacterized protein (DUF1778 family)
METSTMTQENKGTRGGTLKAKPIVVYPQSAEQRASFVEAANSVARGKLSPFMLMAAEKFINEKQKIAYVERPVGGKTIMVYPDSPEQRETFEKAAAKQGVKLSPFMILAAEWFVADKSRY